MHCNYEQFVEFMSRLSKLLLAQSKLLASSGTLPPPNQSPPDNGKKDLGSGLNLLADDRPVRPMPWILPASNHPTRSLPKL